MINFVGRIIIVQLIYINIKRTLKNGIWKVEMEMSILLMFFQTIILAGQLWLTYYIHKSNKTETKGYFMPLNDNLGIPQELKKRITYRYDLTKAIMFQNRGDDMLILLNSVIMVNHRVVEPGKVPLNTLFTNDDSIFSRYGIVIPVSSRDLESNNIDVRIELKMKNSQNYTYKQIFCIEFIKLKEDDSKWEISKCNIEFKN